MSKTVSLFVAFCWLAGAAATLSAADKPDYSGDWKLNVQKSEVGPMSPASMTEKIDHKDPDLKVVTAATGGPQGDVSYQAKYTTDGKECSNEFGGMQAKSTVSWDGSSLTFSTKMNAGDADVVIKGKWTLSADGKTLTQSAHVTTPQGEFDMAYVFEKQ